MPSSMRSALPTRSVAIPEAGKGIGLLGRHVIDMMARKKTKTIMKDPDICSIVTETTEENTKTKVGTTIRIIKLLALYPNTERTLVRSDTSAFMSKCAKQKILQSGCRMSSTRSFHWHDSGDHMRPSGACEGKG